MTRIAFLIIGLLAAPLALGGNGSAHAAGPAVPLPQYEWSFDGITGTFDKQQLQRGLQVYREVCAACHGLKRIAFRNLSFLGYSEAQIKALAAEYTVKDGPNEEGDMFERPALARDRIPSPYDNPQQAAYINGGAYPPDLSLITKARPDGVNYLKALLVGYVDAPEGKEVPEGAYYNKYFPGHFIKMPQPMADGQVTYADGTEATLEQMSADVTAFLAWAAEPHLEARKNMGLATMLFLFVFTFVLYLTKRKIWKRVKDGAV